MKVANQLVAYYSYSESSWPSKVHVYIMCKVCHMIAMATPIGGTVGTVLGVANTL